MPGRAAFVVFVIAQTVCTAMLSGCLYNGYAIPLAGTSLPPNPVIVSSPTAYEIPTVPVSTSTGSVPVYSNATPISNTVPIANTVPVTDLGGMTVVADPGTDTSSPRAKAPPRDLHHIYGRTAQADDLDRNPIIVIPGVLGSRLVDAQTGLVVWGEFGGDSLNPRSPWGARLIAAPMGRGQKLATLVDNVRPAGTLDALDIRILGIPFQVNAYRDLLNALGVGGYRDSQTDLNDLNYGNQSYSSFQFAYDWRRDNVENAKLLHQFILQKKAYIENERRRRYGDNLDPVRFDIVAHSMGGLLARYYLEYGAAELPEDGSIPTPTWAGAEHVDRLVMVGTPNAGSLDTIRNFVQGETLSRFLPRYESAILGTMPALYQLLPRSRQNPLISDADRSSVDYMNPQVWWRLRWGLMDPRQEDILAELLPDVADPRERVQIAYDHLSKCLARAKAFHAAMDAPATPPSGTTIHLIAGDAHPTVCQFKVDASGALTVTGWQPGDSTVSRPSALMDERYSIGVKWSPRLNSPIKWTSVNFFTADHLGLTSDPGFTDNLLYLLLESPR